MITFIFLSISLLVGIGIKFHAIRNYIIPYLLIAIYATSLMPSIFIPYIIDDMDHLFNLSYAMDTSSVMQWVFTPHNEHVYFVLKFLYFFCFKYFWLFPEPFHFVIILMCSGILYLSYRLLLLFTGSPFSAFIGLTILASSNLPDLAAFVITNSHIIFCLFFFLLLFYSQYKYRMEGKKFWTLMIVFSAALIPGTFALGLCVIFYSLVFDRFCIKDEHKKTSKNSFFFVILGWSLGLVPYLLVIDQIILTPHYQDIGQTSVFGIANISNASRHLILYFVNSLIPRLLPNFYLSMGLFFLFLFFSFQHLTSFKQKNILFFLLLGVGISLIIYTFRIAWGPIYLSFSRYDVFPVLTIGMIYTIGLSGFFKKHESVIHNPKYYYAIILFCFLIVSNSAIIRYERATQVFFQTSRTLQNFNIAYRESLKKYFEKYPQAPSVNIKDSYIEFPRIPALTTKAGFVPGMTRYNRKLSFFSQYILDKNVREKIIWGDETDPVFISFLNTQAEFNIFKTLIQ